MTDSQVCSDQVSDRFTLMAHYRTPKECPAGQLYGQPRTAFEGNGDRVCPIGHPGPAPVRLSLTLALTGSQKLSFAIVGLVATVVLIVWPIVRPKRYSKRELDDVMTHGRLRRELEGHQDD